MFTAPLFIIANIQKQPKCPLIDEWIQQMWCIHTMEYHSAVKKNRILPSAMTWIDLESTMLSGMSQTEKDKYHMISLRYEI